VKVLHSDEQSLLQRISIETIVADTCELISARSENPGGVESEAVAVLARMCERIGAQVSLQEVAPGRSNLFASVGPPDAPTILFLGHSDVVPAGDGWATDPFVPRVSEGLITGRGATDMKGGLAAIIAAMGAIAAAHPEIRLELLSTVDEEDQATGARKAMERLEGRSLLACIVAEPTNLDIVIGCRGSTNFHVEIAGKAAHAGRPEDGASSLYVAGMVIEKVRHLQAIARKGRPDPLLGGPSWNVGTVTGGTATSVVPQSTTMTINRRIMPDENPEEILRGLIDAVEAEVATSELPHSGLLSVTGRVVLHMPGFRTAEDSAVPTRAQEVLQEFGVEAPLTGWTAACEGGFVMNATGAPTIIMGPGDLNTQAHQANESVAIDDLLVAAKAYALLALRLNGSQ
jgi:acetylornithine deacetylase